jgi:ketosteroid isomerase-like protein
MSQANVEMVRRGYEAYNRGDIDGAVSEFAPDCRYTAAGTIPDRTGVFHGREGYKEFIGWLRSEFEDAQAELDELIDAGDMVVIGSTLRGQGFVSRKEALEAAGLSE